ncbi:MAG: PAS domain S-box protein [Desulfobulbaceae bacterium]|nr:PAS domain S-box protein [Desulfobulbaceae bacterium]
MSENYSQPESSKAGSLTGWLVARVVLVNFFVFSLVGLFLYQSRINLEKRNEIRTQNMAAVLEDSLAETFGRIDISLFAVKDEIENQLASDGINEEKLNLCIGRYFSLVPQLESIRIADTYGDVLYGIGVVKPVNILDRDYFINLRENDDKGLVFGKPVESRMSGKWVLNIARRLNKEDGSFAGVVYGQVTIANFTDSFLKLNVGKHGSVSLRNVDHEIIARYPETKFTTEGERKNISRQFKELLQSGREQATYKAHFPIDNIERVYTFHRVRKYPLIINVGLATSEYLAIWRKEVIINLLLLLAFSGGSLMFSRALVVRWKSEKSVQMELSRLNETLEQRIQERTDELAKTVDILKEQTKLLDLAHDAILVHDPDAIIKYWNSGAEKTYGWTKEEAVGKKIHDLLQTQFPTSLEDITSRAFSTGQWEGELRHITRNGMPIIVASRWVVHRNPNDDLSEFLVINRDITERMKMVEEKERLIDDLQKALANVMMLSGLIPICASCKKIRDDKGYWNEVESYIRDHSEARFSHGICPECAKKLYPEFFK